MGDETQGWCSDMMGVHVGNSGSSKLYFIVDSVNKRETGALAYGVGGVTFFDFWGWVSANPEIDKIKKNEFQELLWGKPLPQDEDLWESLFFSRATPLSGIIDPELLENIGGDKVQTSKTNTKQSLAKQIMERGQNNGQ